MAYIEVGVRGRASSGVYRSGSGMGGGPGWSSGVYRSGSGGGEREQWLISEWEWVERWRISEWDLERGRAEAYIRLGVGRRASSGVYRSGSGREGEQWRIPE